MTISADIFDLAIFLIGLAVLIFVLALIPALLQLKKTLKAVEDLTVESKKTVEIVNFIAKRTQDQVADLEELVSRVKDLGIKVTGLADLVVENVKSPLINILSVLFGAEEGFKRFFRREKKGGEGDGKH